MAETAALLSDEVFLDVPLRQWAISFPFPLRYLFAAHLQAMGKVLRIVYRTIATHRYSLMDGATGAVTLIQRFGSALKVNIHFHILFLDGVYVCRENRPPGFLRVKAPDKSTLEELVQLIRQRVGRCLERQGLLEQGAENAWLERLAKANGFSLHAGVSCEGHQKDKRERLCRYIARPAVAVPRLSLSSTGKVL